MRHNCPPESKDAVLLQTINVFNDVSLEVPCMNTESRSTFESSFSYLKAIGLRRLHVYNLNIGVCKCGLCNIGIALVKGW